MNLANVFYHNTAYLAHLSEGGATLIDNWPSLDAYLADGQPALQKRRLLDSIASAGHWAAGEELTIRPSVLRPGKLICIGLNYRRHAEETGMAIPTVPVVFSKFSDTPVAHGAVVDIPRLTKKMDYEAELTIVIGQTIHNVDEAHALDGVFGYCNGNDLSARDFQLMTSQWLLGKTCPGFSPLGPFVKTKEDLDDPNTLDIRTYRNGRVVQNSNTSDMIFSCQEIIAFLSRYLVLEPGDIILTGTPEGVIMGQPEGSQDWLKSGDRVVVEIEGLGQLETTLR